MPTTVNYIKGDKFLRVAFNLSSTSDDISAKTILAAQRDGALSRKVASTFANLLEEKLLRVVKEVPEPETVASAEGKNIVALQFALPDKWRGIITSQAFISVARHPRLLARVEELVREKIDQGSSSPQPV